MQLMFQNLRKEVPTRSVKAMEKISAASEPYNRKRLRRPPMAAEGTCHAKSQMHTCASPVAHAGGSEARKETGPGRRPQSLGERSHRHVQEHHLHAS